MRFFLVKWFYINFLGCFYGITSAVYELSAALDTLLDTLLEGYNRLLDKLYRKKKYKKYILGAFRVLEVTHNLDLNSEFFNTFYPCLHCILMVDKGYFSKCYIS